MAESFLLLKAGDQREILEAASAKCGYRATRLEKDIWLCWVLQTIFSIPDHHPMAFKGGTSLSKVHGIIDRFSEDVDITLDHRTFNTNLNPFATSLSKSQLKKLSDRLKSYVKNHTQDVVIPTLKNESEILATNGQHKIRSDESGEKVWFSYPSVAEDSDEYLASDILLEFGGRNVIDPSEHHTFDSDIASIIPETNLPTATVTVLSPLRTFWEKATLIHVECNRGRLFASPERLSRHWYDLVCLGQHKLSEDAINNRSLFESVVEHKKLFFNSKYSHYDDCLAGKLRLIPDHDDLIGLHSDYRQMQAARMLSDNAPNFDVLIEQVRMIENQVNCWS